MKGAITIRRSRRPIARRIVQVHGSSLSLRHAATGAGPLLIANEGAGPSPDAARGRVAHGGGAGRGG